MPLSESYLVKNRQSHFKMNREKEDISRLRQNYQRSSLELIDLHENPIIQFDRWLHDAIREDLLEPNAMILSTINAAGRPTSRTVLLKELEAENGFIFYTNYSSNKAKDLKNKPFGSLVFLWKELERQVRVEGAIEKISEEKATAYFQTRPKGSQLGAWASPQSQIISDRSIIDEALINLEQQYAEVDHLPKPPFWGGYVLKPDNMEFWQGRRNRLHDRYVYKKNEAGIWNIHRLAP